MMAEMSGLLLLLYKAVDVSIFGVFCCYFFSSSKFDPNYLKEALPLPSSES